MKINYLFIYNYVFTFYVMNIYQPFSIRGFKCTMLDYFQILCGLGVVFLSLYYYYTSTYNYWKNRGVPGPRPIIFAGNFGPVVAKTLSLSDHTKKLYDEYKHEPVFGIYEGLEPVLVVNDLDLIKDVFIRDFSVFVHRGFRFYPKVLENYNIIYTNE